MVGGLTMSRFRGFPGILEYMDQKRSFTKSKHKNNPEGTWHLLVWPSWKMIPEGKDREYGSPQASHFHFVCNKAWNPGQRIYVYQIVKAVLTVRWHRCP